MIQLHPEFSTRPKALVKFKGFLETKRLKVTNPRLAILAATLDQKNHFTAENLLEKAKHVDQTVSRATVYRTLSILIESEIIREINIGRDHKFYKLHEEESTFKAQVICKDCDKIQEVDAPFMEWYGKTAADRLGLKVHAQRLQLEVHCDKNCQTSCSAKKEKR